MTNRPEYTELEHTADVGIELVAPDLRSAYERAAAAVFDLMCDLDGVAVDRSFELSVEGRPGDLEHLMVRWLSELLFLYSSEHVLLSSFEIEELVGVGASAASASGSRGGSHDDERVLRIVARVRGETFDATRHRVKVEIKAVTYHGLTVERTERGWSVRVIFDT